jgi:cytochrome P450
MTEQAIDLGVRYPAEGALECPYPFYEKLHEAGVYQVPGTHDFLVSRYEDVLWVLRHPELFSSRRGFMYEKDPELAAVAARGYPPVPTVVDNDDPAHAAYKQLIFQAIAPRRLTAFEPMIARIVNELIDGFIDRGEVEFISEFAMELPLRIFAEILEISPSEVPDLRRWVGDWVTLLSQTASKERALELQESVVEYDQFIARTLEERMRNPGDDVLSELVQSRIDPAFPLGMTELVALAKIFVTAGTESTLDMMGNAMNLLLENPDQMASVAESPKLIPKMIEEALRTDPPTHWAKRVTLEDTEVGGVRIPAGSRVVVVLGAANRDDRMFDNPDRFDIDRANSKRHVAFGSGIHTCVGAPLARLEGRIAFEALLSRAENWRRAVPSAELRHGPSPMLRGLTSLPLLFDARS